jgi:ferric-dicitrate binding protein FerR (iron transport regulator)
MMPLPPEEFELLSAYLDNALTTRQRQALEARLAASPELRAQLDDLRAVRAMLRAAPALKPPRDFRLDPARYARRAWWSRLDILRLTSALSAAAAVLLLALGIVLSGTPSAPSDGIALQATDLSTPTTTMRMPAPTPTMPLPAAAPFMATVAPLAAATTEMFTATPDVALEAAMLMATEAAPEGVSAAATETPAVPEQAPAASEAALSPVARLLILLGALLLIIGGVLFFIGTFRARL